RQPWRVFVFQAEDGIRVFHVTGVQACALPILRDEILRSRRIGLNGMRVHVKIEHPRKLYWADRLGMLIMADVPNSWGEPTPEMRDRKSVVEGQSVDLEGGGIIRRKRHAGSKAK